MQKTSKRIIFFGNERIATGTTTTTPTLRKLCEHDYNVVAIIASNQSSASRNRRELEVAATAQAYDIPLLLPSKLRDIRKQIADLKPDAGVLVAYGEMIPQDIIRAFPKGIINMHPSLLPLHRGPTPLESVILNGEKETGVSIMQLVKDMDAGPVFAQQKIQLRGYESKQELADWLLELGSATLLNVLPQILIGSLHAKTQDDSKATYDKLLSKEDGVIDWRKSAEQLEREVRAFRGWPNSRTQLAGKDIFVTKAHATPTNHPGARPGDVTIAHGVIMIECGNGTLCIERLKPAGKQEMTSDAFIAGHKQLL